MENKRVVIDCETTGLPPKEGKYDTHFMEFPYIVELAFKINNQNHSFIINQEKRTIPKEAVDLHGITNDMCAASPHILEDVILGLIHECQGVDRVVGFNFYFDTSILKANVLRLIQQGKLKQESYTAIEEIFHKDKRIDIMRIGAPLCGRKGGFCKLTELYKALFNKDFPAHRATDDVNATDECFLELDRRGLIKPKNLPIGDKYEVIGQQEGRNIIKCPPCKSTGEVLNEDPKIFKLRTCEVCKGKGWCFEDELPKPPMRGIDV